MSILAWLIICVLCATAIRAQSATDWQTRAGGKMAFEVASVKPGHGPAAPSTVSLTPSDDNRATNGLFRADATLLAYIQFAL